MLGATALNAGLRTPQSLPSSQRLIGGRRIAAPQLSRPGRHLGDRSRVCQIKAIAEAKNPSASSSGSTNVNIDNSGPDDTVITLFGENRPGKLPQTCTTSVPVNIFSDSNA